MVVALRGSWLLVVVVDADGVNERGTTGEPRRKLNRQEEGLLLLPILLPAELSVVVVAAELFTELGGLRSIHKLVLKLEVVAVAVLPTVDDEDIMSNPTFELSSLGIFLARKRRLSWATSPSKSLDVSNIVEYKKKHTLASTRLVMDNGVSPASTSI